MKPRTFKKIILDDLKKRGREDLIKKIKSITYETFSMGNAVRVRTVDLFKSERIDLEAILNKYAYGRFDGMTDYAFSEQNNEMERQAKYVTLSNDFSDTITSACKLKSEDYWEVASALESYDDAIKLLEARA